MPTVKELQSFRSIKERIEKLRHFLISNIEPESIDASSWYSYLSRFKSLQGNPNTDISFIATYMAKEYLEKHFDINFDSADKPQGAPGLDIDIITNDGERIIAEIKTTYPYKVNDLGAQQANTFNKDFRKLAENTASHKFFFLTEAKTFDLMRMAKYKKQLRGVNVVLLPTGKKFAG